MEFYGVRYPKGAKIVDEESKEVGGWLAYISVVVKLMHLQICTESRGGEREGSPRQGRSSEAREVRQRVSLQVLSV